MDKLCTLLQNFQLTEKEIDQHWSVLEGVLEILEELCIAYLEDGDVNNQKEVMKESQSLESEIQAALEKARKVVKLHVQISAPTACASHENQTKYSSFPNVSEGQLNSGLPSPSLQNVQNVHAEGGNSENSPGAVFANHHLKALKMPTFRADKIKLEHFWMLFWTLNLVDQSNETINLKMARLQQCLFNSALESIKGPGNSEPEKKQKAETSTEGVYGSAGENIPTAEYR